MFFLLKNATDFFYVGLKSYQYSRIPFLGDYLFFLIQIQNHSSFFDVFDLILKFPPEQV